MGLYGAVRDSMGLYRTVWDCRGAVGDWIGL